MNNINNTLVNKNYQNFEKHYIWSNVSWASAVVSFIFAIGACEEEQAKESAKTAKDVPVRTWSLQSCPYKCNDLKNKIIGSSPFKGMPTIRQSSFFSILCFGSVLSYTYHLSKLQCYEALAKIEKKES